MASLRNVEDDEPDPEYNAELFTNISVDECLANAPQDENAECRRIRRLKNAKRAKRRRNTKNHARVLYCLHVCLWSNHVTGSPQPQQHDPDKQGTTGSSIVATSMQLSILENDIPLEHIDDPMLVDERMKEFNDSFQDLF
jgi:hypothetical protein